MKRRCNHCGCYVAGLWIDGFPAGCARSEDVEDRQMCKTTRIDLLEMALRRALVPDAFDERARIKQGRLIDVLDAEQQAIRQVAALSGPILAAAIRSGETG